MSGDPGLASWLSETQAWADAALERALTELDCGPPEHEEALRYALFGGGKRLRPALVRLVCEHLGGSASAAAPAAAAIELVHTYSLVHDDLPCMDDDDLRRGRPTTHKVYGEAQAVLCGDGLLTLAFEWLARHGGSHAREMVRVLASGAGPGGMVGGQVLDLAGRDDAELAAVERIHDMKTAALIAAAVELGALCAGAVDERRAALRGYGRALGRLFQAVDDLLDVTGDVQTLGKTPGKDADDHKATLVAALGLDGARDAARRWAEAARGYAREAGSGEEGRLMAVVAHFQARTS